MKPTGYHKASVKKNARKLLGFVGLVWLTAFLRVKFYGAQYEVFGVLVMGLQGLGRREFRVFGCRLL